MTALPIPQGKDRYIVPEWLKDKEPAIFPALKKAMALVEAVAKNRRNKDQSYNFRGIDDVYTMIHGVLAEAGITTPPQVFDRELGERGTKSGGSMTHVRMLVGYWFTGEDGSAVLVGPIWSEALDTSDKAHNKALAFAHKYCLLQAFCIPTEDVAEGDRETLDRGEPAPQQPTHVTRHKANEPPPQQQQPEQPIGEDKAKRIYEWFLGAGVSKATIDTKLGKPVATGSPVDMQTLVRWQDEIKKDRKSIARLFGSGVAAGGNGNGNQGQGDSSPNPGG